MSPAPIVVAPIIDVVKFGGVVRPLADGINVIVEETNKGDTGRRGLLVGQGDKRGPKRR